MPIASRRPRRAARQAGFTLMEVMVALLVLSIAVVAVLQLFGGGLRLARTAAEHQEATLLASEKLGELVLEDLEEGTTEGIEGDFRWSRRVAFDHGLQPLGDADPTAPETVRLARVTVDVHWGKNRHVELVTLRAVPAKS